MSAGIKYRTSFLPWSSKCAAYRHCRLATVLVICVICLFPTTAQTFGVYGDLLVFGGTERIEREKPIVPHSFVGDFESIISPAGAFVSAEYYADIRRASVKTDTAAMTLPGAGGQYGGFSHAGFSDILEFQIPSGDHPALSVSLGGRVTGLLSAGGFGYSGGSNAYGTYKFFLHRSDAFLWDTHEVPTFYVHADEPGITIDDRFLLTMPIFDGGMLSEPVSVFVEVGAEMKSGGLADNPLPLQETVMDSILNGRFVSMQVPEGVTWTSELEFQPVPIPSPLVLISSSLVALVGIRRWVGKRCRVTGR